MKVLSVNLVMPLRVNTDEGMLLLYLDFMTGDAFNEKGESIDNDLKATILADIQEQQSLAEAVVPTDLVQQALNTKKKLGVPEDAGI